MLQCPQCGKELKHRGALNGHLAFAHGVVTERGKTINELREEVAILREEMDSLYYYFRPYEGKMAGRKFNGLITYDSVNSRVLVLNEFDAEKSEFSEDGTVIIQGRIVEEPIIVNVEK